MKLKLRETQHMTTALWQWQVSANDLRRNFGDKVMHEQSKFTLNRAKSRTHAMAARAFLMVLLPGSGCAAPRGDSPAEVAEDAGVLDEAAADKANTGLPDLKKLTGISNADAKARNYANSFRCSPCNKSNCTMTDLDRTVSVRLRLNTSSNKKADLTLRTCGQIRAFLYRRGATPEQCGAIQTVVRRTSDPCGCAPSYDRTAQCPADAIPASVCPELCGSGKVIGDPDMVIQSGILDGLTCREPGKANKAGACENQCKAARESVQAWC